MGKKLKIEKTNKRNFTLEKRKNTLKKLKLLQIKNLKKSQLQIFQMVKNMTLKYLKKVKQ